MRTNIESIEKSVKRYSEQAISRIYLPATITEKEAYQNVRGTRIAIRPRIKEVIEFGKLLGIKKMGIAFCAGLRNEAFRLTQFLEEQNFEVVSIVCKCGGIDKTQLGISEDDKINNVKTFEAACNPLLQADLLNQAGTELNLIVGLCLGHDILFTQHSNAPVTTIIVKDRMLGHNPVIGLYSSYHKDLIRTQQRR
jgi:uncharacterized metal-binding protein